MAMAAGEPTGQCTHFPNNPFRDWPFAGGFSCFGCRFLSNANYNKNPYYYVAGAVAAARHSAAIDVVVVLVNGQDYTENNEIFWLHQFRLLS